MTTDGRREKNTLAFMMKYVSRKLIFRKMNKGRTRVAVAKETVTSTMFEVLLCIPAYRATTKGA